DCRGAPGRLPTLCCILRLRRVRTVERLCPALDVFRLILRRIGLRKQLCDFLRWPRVRQWKFATANDRIETLRHEDDESHVVAQTAGDPTGFGAGTIIDVGARRSGDR